MKKTVSIISLSILMGFMSSCYPKHDDYFVEPLNMVISIDEIGVIIDKNDNVRHKYRVYLSDKKNISQNNYIEMVGKPSSMPGPTFYFPLWKIGKTDTIYIIDQYCDITAYKSNDYTFIFSSFEEINDSAGQRWEWTDSTIFDIPSVKVQIGEYYNGLWIFNEHGYCSEIEKMKR